MRGRDHIHPRERAQVGETRQEVAVGGHIGAQRAGVVCAQRKYLVVRVEGDLDFRRDIARVLVGEDRLAAVAGPFHGTAELLRQPQHVPVLEMPPALGAERAADVVADDAYAVLRHLQHAGQNFAHAMRVLHVAMQRVAPGTGIPFAQRAARLEKLRVHARDAVAALHHPCRAGEGGVGGGAIADLEDIADVVRTLFPDGIGNGLGVVVHGHEFGRVLCLRQRFGDDDGDGVTDVAHHVLRQARMRAPERRPAVRPAAL